MIYTLFWCLRAILGHPFRSLNNWFDNMEADVEFLVRKYRESNMK